MAVPTGTFTTFSQVGIREDLTNAIYDISPMETPFMSTIQRGAPAKNRFIEWQTDILATAAVNKAIEGDDATYNTATATVRPRNYTQISQKAISVSGTAQAVTLAGREEELAYQIAKRSKEIKRDIEVQLTGNNASSAGTASTARRCAGFEAWITTNDSRGTGGADGGYTAAGTVTAATDASSTNQRTFTEARLKAVILNCWNSGGQPSIVMVGPVNKQKASGFVGITTKYSDFGNAGKSDALTIVAAADMYLSDFGKLRIVPNRFSRERTAMVIDPEYWSMHYLRPFAVNPLAKTGDADKRQLITEYTLCSRNQRSSGVVADLTTT
ncbi:MAG: head protein [Caulobacteraceae bacterium]|nr:head protein [Caulobacteraceae bacterium]